MGTRLNHGDDEPGAKNILSPPMIMMTEAGSEVYPAPKIHKNDQLNTQGFHWPKDY